MFNLLYKQLIEADLQSLIGTSNESQFIDFKEFAYREPPASALQGTPAENAKAKSKWKLDLCKDICAFANANGGLIICGMLEENGVATEVCGLGPDINQESTITRLEQAVLNGIEPPVSNVHCYSVSLADPAKSKVIVIPIHRSFAAPHRVIDPVTQAKTFYIRRSNRNEEMTLNELRGAFSLSESITERTRDFRRQRILAISNDNMEQMPFMLNRGIRLVLHFVPISSFELGQFIDLSPLTPEYSPEWVQRNYLNYGYFNLDGYLAYHGSTPKHADGYTQIYRTGIIECVYLIHALSEPDQDKVSIQNIELKVIKQIKLCFDIGRNLGIETPVVLLLSIDRLRDRSLIPNSAPGNRILESNPVIKKNTLLLPDLFCESYEQDIYALLKPLFDILWNAGGYARSHSYTESGVWTLMKP